jgi:DNA-binding transcriptional ArsR family regulator
MVALAITCSFAVPLPISACARDRATSDRGNVISNIIETNLDERRQLRQFDHHGNELQAVTPGAATEALAALAQEHRLALFRLLVQAGEPGMSAGAIAAALGLPNSSLSFHLAHLRRAGLILQERRHRSLIYRANYPAMTALVGFLTENCCGGADCEPEPIPNSGAAA